MHSGRQGNGPRNGTHQASRHPTPDPAGAHGGGLRRPAGRGGDARRRPRPAGAGYFGPDWIEQQFDAAGNTPVGIGFITWHMAKHPEQLEAALARKPRVVMLSFGDARPFAAAIKDAGAALISQIQTVAQAVEALDIGADIVVAQGTEAGGHGATRSTLALVPAVVDAVRQRNGEVLVVAAGGIADGRGLAAALMLGAHGALLGTRFLASDEALTSAAVNAQRTHFAGSDPGTTFVLSPGFRTGWNLGEKQLIVGLALPVSWRNDADAGAFFYLSYELPFSK